MLQFIKKNILSSRQHALQRKYPDVKIFLHTEMAVSSINKMVEVAKTVKAVNAFEQAMQELSDGELREKTVYLRSKILEKARLLQPEVDSLKEALHAASIQEEKDKLRDKIKGALNKIFADVLPEAFAVVREASKRTIGLRHFDVQIAGGVVLHEGMIAEMATGEGKTLVATLPAYLNALLGQGVHIVTVNDYLAKRDREWMGPIFEFLGLSVGVIQHEMSDEQRKRAYACDITYGTNNEFGFDYLRDNMKYSVNDLVQRQYFFAIVDEVDSILVDEARTPLIISGPAEESTDKYYTAKKISDQLKGKRVVEDRSDERGKNEELYKGFDYVADEKAQTVALTDEGESKAAKLWGIENLHSIETIEYRHHTISALRAKEFFKRDVEYVIKDNQVLIVDEFTGRLMPGRRWSDGLHQAVEAKEGLKIEEENQTLATITFQNYFRMYEKLAGMTGTAFTEAGEFKTIYRLEVVTIPTNRPLIRANNPDCIYKTEKEKFDAVVEEIIDLYEKGKPVLVGTITIDKSEFLSALLKRRGIAHQVLNAKYHEMEAQIVAQAGRFKGVTIATNMAGRGTDILLGGNAEFTAKSIIKQKFSPDDPHYQEEYKKLLVQLKREAEIEHDKVVSLGGLHVLGTERHEARRIDNQLRGRSGRQGDPGSSRFYVSLEDDLMRLFGSDKLMMIMNRLGFEEGQVIEHPWVTKSIEIAQRRLEQHNFEIRKQLLEYDNVMNKQREVIYSQRREILEGVSLKENVFGIIERMLSDLINAHSHHEASVEKIDTASELVNILQLKFGIAFDAGKIKTHAQGELREYLMQVITRFYEEKEEHITPEMMRHLERMVFLQIIDAKWKDHLYAMDKLREGISLRAYGQRDPLIEYKREAFNCFSEMIANIEEEAVDMILKLQPAAPTQFKGVFSSVSKEFVHPEVARVEAAPAGETSSMQSLPPSPAKNQGPVQHNEAKVGRNDPCPCGSGKKYKKCCGA